MTKKVIRISMIGTILLLLSWYFIPKSLDYKATCALDDIIIDFETNQPPPSEYFEAIEELELASKFPIFGQSSYNKSKQQGGILYAKLFTSSLYTISSLNFQSFDNLTANMKKERRLCSNLSEERRISEEILQLRLEMNDCKFNIKPFKPQFITNKEKAYYYCKFWKSTIDFYEKNSADSQELTANYYSLCKICDNDKE